MVPVRINIFWRFISLYIVCRFLCTSSRLSRRCQSHKEHMIAIFHVHDCMFYYSQCPRLHVLACPRHRRIHSFHVKSPLCQYNLDSRVRVSKIRRYSTLHIEFHDFSRSCCFAILHPKIAIRRISVNFLLCFFGELSKNVSLRQLAYSLFLSYRAHSFSSWNTSTTLSPPCPRRRILLQRSVVLPPSHHRHRCLVRSVCLLQLPSQPVPPPREWRMLFRSALDSFTETCSSQVWKFFCPKPFTPNHPR